MLVLLERHFGPRGALRPRGGFEAAAMSDSLHNLATSAHHGTQTPPRWFLSFYPITHRSVYASATESTLYSSTLLYTLCASVCRGSLGKLPASSTKEFRQFCSGAPGVILGSGAAPEKSAPYLRLIFPFFGNGRGLASSTCCCAPNTPQAPRSLLSHLWTRPAHM